jgi:hypothetical protein
MIEGLDSQAPGESTIADDSNYMMMLTRQVSSERHTQGSRDGCAGMTSTKDIVRALSPICESGEASILSDAWELLPPPRQKLVHVALMSYIPHNFIGGAVENSMQSNSQFDDPQVGRKVAST